jgi:protein involved in ribonucleotide reduction
MDKVSLDDILEYLSGKDNLRIHHIIGDMVLRNREEGVRYLLRMDKVDNRDIVYVNRLLSNIQYYLNIYDIKKDVGIIRQLILPVQVSMQPRPIQIRTEPTKSTISITLDEFISVINDNNFIQRYLESIRYIIRWKREFYTHRINVIYDEYGRIIERINQLNINDISIKINDIVDVTSLLTEYIYIYDIIQRLDNIVVNEQTLRKNLNDIIGNPEYGINSIVGRDDVKRTLVGILYSFANKPQLFIDTFNNIALYGPSGVGKTRLGQVISFILSKSYILVKDNFLVKSRSDLVSQWIGGTAIKTRSLLYSSLESVLFIDEAYQLVTSTTGTGHDYGQESIGEILTFLDKYKGKCVIIVSGYQKEMEDFMKSNEGLPRRFLYTMILNPYTVEELTIILIRTISKYYPIDHNTSSYIHDIMDKLYNHDPKVFDKQAGDILNLSTFILRKISSSYRYRWDHEKDRIVILLEAFNEYLQQYKHIPISLYQ